MNFNNWQGHYVLILKIKLFVILKNTKNSWKYINSQLKIQPSQDTLHRHRSDITIAYLDWEKSELLNNYFSSVFTQKNLLSIPSFNLDKSIDPITDIV